eukprot:357336-Chlamydomonas_euryale.AAC.1
MVTQRRCELPVCRLNGIVWTAGVCGPQGACELRGRWRPDCVNYSGVSERQGNVSSIRMIVGCRGVWTAGGRACPATTFLENVHLSESTLEWLDCFWGAVQWLEK